VRLSVVQAENMDNGMSPAMGAALEFGLRYFNTLESEGIEDFVAEDWILHDAQAGNRDGVDGFLEWGQSFHALMPDFALEVDDLVANDNRLAFRWSFTGTHTGAIPGIPPSGQEVALSGMVFHHFEDGRFRESWLYYDNLSFLTQINALPVPHSE
jgi:steroid delta-isomerase-like uncharacterized protein